MPGMQGTKLAFSGDNYRACLVLLWAVHELWPTVSLWGEAGRGPEGSRSKGRECFALSKLVEAPVRSAV